MNTSTSTPITTWRDARRYDNRITFSETLIRLAERDERVVAVCNDSVSSSKLNEFATRFSKRLINVGIAEQNMVGVGAGLAASGFIPFVCSAAPFLTARALEQIKADVAYSQHSVILCGISPGMAYGELGPTHHSIEDLSFMRALPGLDVVLPADRLQTELAVAQAVAEPRPTYMRIGRHPVPDLPIAELQRGKAVQVRDGDAATIIASGSLVIEALLAAETLAAVGIQTRVINSVYVTPFDAEAVLDAATKTGAIVVAEEAMVSGGIGAAVASTVAQERGLDVAVRLLGTDTFAPTGDNQLLLDHFGLNATSIAAAVQELVA